MTPYAGGQQHLKSKFMNGTDIEIQAPDVDDALSFLGVFVKVLEKKEVCKNSNY
jgi:hypothetical protein